jgi:hypothetical protein
LIANKSYCINRKLIDEYKQKQAKPERQLTMDMIIEMSRNMKHDASSSPTLNQQ